MLRTALGPAIAGYLEDPSIVEVMLNPDGRLWIDRLSGGLEDTGCRVTPADAERIVRLVAHHVGVEVHAGSPRVSAELPESGERFEGDIKAVNAEALTPWKAENLWQLYMTTANFMDRSVDEIRYHAAIDPTLLNRLRAMVTPAKHDALGRYLEGLP